jgi:hypothetical protein
METLVTLATEIYNYKGLEVKRIDSIKESQFSTTSAYPAREWFIDGIKAHTYEVEGEVKLAFYDVPAHKGGIRKVLASFTPDVPFYIENTEKIRDLVYELTGKFVISEVVEY